MYGVKSGSRRKRKKYINYCIHVSCACLRKSPTDRKSAAVHILQNTYYNFIYSRTYRITHYTKHANVLQHIIMVYALYTRIYNIIYKTVRIYMIKRVYTAKLRHVLDIIPCVYIRALTEVYNNIIVHNSIKYPACRTPAAKGRSRGASAGVQPLQCV